MNAKQEAERTLVSFDWAMKSILRDKANFDVLEAFHSKNIQSARTKLAVLHMNAEERHQYEVFMLSRANALDLLDSKFQQGIEQGLQQGIEQTARGMKGEGINLQLIAKITGLTEQEIMAL